MFTLFAVIPAIFAVSGPFGAPEIDGAAAVAAVALLGGAVMVLRGRRRK